MTILAIIPAAGKGSRLNIKKPKIMVRVGRKLIIDILIEKIQHLVEKIIFVVNPKYAQQISNYLKKKYKNKLNFKIIISKLF